MENAEGDFDFDKAQSDLRDPTGSFWRKMKSQTDSSDSGEKKSDSSTELCRISIKCSIPEPSSSQTNLIKNYEKSDSESPPIITEEVAPRTSQASDEDSVKSYDIQSQRSNDATLDTSVNKPHSPTSSITSQRKLEWDSLADVGYANESDRKTSASSLSTLERLALKQQYSHNDSRQNIELEPPTSHSTPVEEPESKSKGKKVLKKTTKIYQKDIDFVELNLPHCSQINQPQAINVNLSKHISFNMDKDGEINIDNIKRNISLSPDKVVEIDRNVQNKMDKEIQTSLESQKDKSASFTNISRNIPVSSQKFPILISLNTLKKRNRQKKLRRARKKLRNKTKLKANRKNVSQEKSTEQVSEAESFEYMPGHMYNPNPIKINHSKVTHIGNKSSLESSVGLTTDSSKGSKYSFSKDLDRSIELLKAVLQQHSNDSALKKKLIKEVVQKLIKSKYRDDESSTDFLSGLSFNSKTMGQSVGNHTTTSTSCSNSTGNKTRSTRPGKSILRIEKFNSNMLASNSQSTPNLPAVANIDKSVTSDMTEPHVFSNIDSDISHKQRNSPDIKITRTSSEELYKKYLEALRKEQAYKKHLKNKEKFLKQKLVSSETAITQLEQADLKTQCKLKSLLKDLTRNNYNDGSGDARKLEEHKECERNLYPFLNRQRSQSVYTLSSGNCDGQNENSNFKSRIQNVLRSSSKTHSKNEHVYCCCPFHTDHRKVEFTDSSVQVNIEYDGSIKKKKNQEVTYDSEKCMGCNKESLREIPKILSHSVTKDHTYVCICSKEAKAMCNVSENFLIYKGSLLVDKTVQPSKTFTRNSYIDETCNTDNHNACSCKQIDIHSQTIQGDCNYNIAELQKNANVNIIPLAHHSKSSQTNINSNQMLEPKSSVKSVSSQSSGSTNFMPTSNIKSNETAHLSIFENNTPKPFIHEAVRSIQTEISINPRISDPCLSDINIIDKKDCVKLINEQYKQICTSKTENNNEENLSEKDKQLCCEGSSLNVVNKSAEKLNENKIIDNNIHIANSDKEVQSDINPIDDTQNTNIVDQFTIPIQGTNMTVKVNLGSRDNTVPLKNKLTKSEGVVTENVKVAEEFTSLRDDCTKGVQCNDASIFQQIDPDCNKNNKEKQTPLKSDDCIANINFKYNTFPKEEQYNRRKPLLRTNTDVACCAGRHEVQLDLQKRDTIAKQQEPDSENLKTVTDSQIPEDDQSTKFNCGNIIEKYSSVSPANSCKPDVATKIEEQCLDCHSKKSNIQTSESFTQFDVNNDRVLDIIEDITKRYSKKDIEKSKRKKCFKEIVGILNYLLNTEDSTDEQNKKSIKDSTDSKDESIPHEETVEPGCCSSKMFVDKGIQLTTKKSKSNKYPNTQSEKSHLLSTEFPTTSSDSATCKVLNKIKKECEKYHQKRCKSHNGLKTCETSSSTSVNCDQCKRLHQCYCIKHKCRPHRSKAENKPKKKCVAYNLILQTSDSIVSEGTSGCHNRVPLKNIIVKVPSKKKQVENVPFKEMAAKFDRNKQCPCSPKRSHRSRSLPNDSEISSTDEFLRNTQTYTVREYLEQNRPDFVEKTTKRQDCLKVINETRPEMCPSRYYKMVVVHNPKCAAHTCSNPGYMYCGGGPIICNPCVNPHIPVQNDVTRIAHERDAKRKLLSLQLARQQSLSTMTDYELRHFAKQLSEELRRKQVAPKFISEREMKKHSEKIYKSLPEVTRKKEELKKENIKKTNLLMANIFKKNLQKKTLRGSVNLSNYSTVVKI